MSVYDDLASILRKAQGIITEDGNEIDVGREVVMLRSAHEEQKARIAELEQQLSALREAAGSWVTAHYKACATMRCAPDEEAAAVVALLGGGG